MLSIVTELQGASFSNMLSPLVIGYCQLVILFFRGLGQANREPAPSIPIQQTRCNSTAPIFFQRMEVSVKKLMEVS